jgi:tetratricopeptide (TPR) repeat protein
MLVFVLLGAAVLSGCSPHAALPPPAPATGDRPAQPVAPQRPVALERPENAYFYFLSSQKERRAGNIDKAILLIRKAIQLDPRSAYLSRELATIYLQNKEEQNAQAVVEELLARQPDDVDALILYGSIKQMRRETGAAIQAFEKVIRLDPAQEKIHSLLAGLYLEAKDLAGAERVLSAMIARFPESYDGHFLLGRVHQDRGRAAPAAKQFRKAAELDPESIEPLFELLKIAREGGKRDELLRISQEILERDPDNSRAQLELALYYRQSGMKAQADQILRRLGEKSVSEFEVVLQLVQFYVDPKKYADALVLIQGMLAGAPDSPDLHHLKGFSLFGLKKNTEALPEFRQVTPESRFYSDAVVHIAFILQEQGKTAEAVEQLVAASRMNPENTEFKYYLGTIYEEAGQLDEAEKSLKEALDKDPRNSRYYFRLGVVYDKKSDKKASMDAMRKVLELDPQNASALNYLGYTYADLGENLDEAERLIQQALQLKPKDGYITDSLGWVFYKKGDYPRAMEYLKKAAALVPDDPTILEHIGDTYLQLNDKGNALKYYQRALSKKEKDKGDLQQKIRQLKERGR